MSNTTQPKRSGYSSDIERGKLLDEIPERDASGRAFADFPLALWRERSKRTKDARRGAWHCSNCGQSLALSFSDYGEPLWIYDGTKFSNARGDGDESHVWRSGENYPGQNPTGKDARRLSMLCFPALILCSNPACARWQCVPREARRTGSKKQQNGLT